MDGNKNKKMILGIISVAILIAIIVGVSYAFYSYNRTSTKNNLVTTGKLVFDFTDKEVLKITNAFPITTLEGLSQADPDVCRFTISGYTSNGQTINYKVYAIPGDPIGTKERFIDDVVFLNIKRTDTNTGGTFNGVTEYFGNNASAIVMTNGKIDLGTGSITSTNEVIMDFEVRIWLDDSKIFISDTEIQENQPGKVIYNTDDYTNSYYSLKIVVEAVS